MKRKYIPLSDNLKTIFEHQNARNASDAPQWLAEERKACNDLVLQHALPAQGQEAWKYMDVSKVNDIHWALPTNPLTTADAVLAAQSQIKNEHVLHLTLLNGSYIPSADTLPQGIDIQSLGNPTHVHNIKPVLQRTNYRLESVFASMNRAIWHDGIYITIAAETKAKLHIHFVYGAEGHSPILAAPRAYIKAGSHCELELTISQWNRDKSPALATPCIDVDLAAGAKVTYAHEQLLNPESMLFSTSRMNLERDASLHTIEVALGAALARHDLTVSLHESGSEATLNGIYLLRNRQTTDFHTRIEHRKPHSRSRQVYKGVIDDHAHAIFNGLVEVHPGAMGTDGYQLNRTLLRSPHAVIDTKPELQIHNDDVRCSHGATIGQIDPIELFYLQSRCIPTDIALKMLSRAFVMDLVQQQPSVYQQARLAKSVETFFENHEHQ